MDPSSQGTPLLNISGNSQGCITGSGAFAIESLQIQAGKLVDFTATFEQHCNDAPAALRGCLHVAQ